MFQFQFAHIYGTLYRYMFDSSILSQSRLAVHLGRLLEQDVAVFRSTTDVNYFGVVNTVKAAVPRMVERGEGQVVIVASVMAIIGA